MRHVKWNEDSVSVTDTGNTANVPAQLSEEKRANELIPRQERASFLENTFTFLLQQRVTYFLLQIVGFKFW